MNNNTATSETTMTTTTNKNDINGVISKDGSNNNTMDESNDYLVPSFDDTESRNATIISSVFNLIATMIGGGVLSLPLAFDKCGIVVATILMIFAALITDRSLYLLCYTSRRMDITSSSSSSSSSCTMIQPSYAQVGKVAIGDSMDWFISGLLCTFLIFVIIAYMVLLKDIWTPLVQELSILPTTINGSIVLLCIILIMTPFLIQRNLHTLRFNCYIGIGAVCILCYALIHHGMIIPLKNIISSTHTDGNESSTTMTEVLLSKIKLYPDTYDDVLFAFPIIILSFLSIFNVLPIQNNLIRPTRERIQLIIRWAVIVCFLIQYFFGLSGYLHTTLNNEPTEGNILLNIVDNTNDTDNNDWMFLLGRLGYGITIMLALAMMMLPCRENLLEFIHILLFTMNKNKNNNGDDDNNDEESNNNNIAGEKTSLLSSTKNVTTTTTNEYYSIKTCRWWHYGSTFVIGIVSFIFACMAPGVAFVWSICGSSMAFLLSFILPAACYLAIIKQNKQTTKKDKNKKNELPWIYFSWFLIIFSIISSIACTYRTIVVMF